MTRGFPSLLAGAIRVRCPSRELIATAAIYLELRVSVTDMTTRIMLPCDGYSPSWEWLDTWQLDALQDWWGSSARLARESVGAPAWAEYVDRDGAAWSREGLLVRLVFDAIDLFGEAHVDATIKELGNDGMTEMLDGWLEARVFAGELVRLVSESEA